jgi:hypothetical protein
MEEKFIRWHAEVFYRTAKHGLCNVEWDLEEIEDLQDLVESGPHWDTIDHIVITRVNHCDSPMLTIEQADKL